MKHTVQKCFTLLTIIFIFGLYSCEKELYDEGTANKNNFKMHRITLEELQQIPNAFNKIKSIKEAQSKMQMNRIIYDSLNDFTIDTDKIVLAEKEGVIWLTIPIKRNYETDKTENLVLKSETDGTYLPFLFKYDFTEEDKNTIISGDAVDNMASKTSVYPLELYLDDIVSNNNERTTICVKVTFTYCSFENAAHPEGQTGAGANCPGHAIGEEYICGTIDDLTGGGFGDDDGWTGNENNPNEPTNSGGGGSATPTPTPIITVPLLELEDDTEEEENITYPLENVDLIENLLINNPFALLNIPCAQIPYWQTIAQHQVPQTVKDKIENIDAQTGWFTSSGIQTLNDANNGAVVNMDFFPVTISQMPKKLNGQTYTQKELFDYIRTHINDFFDDLNFTPIVNSNYNINDGALWLSNNPLGAILSINIAVNQGSVVCSKYNSTTGEFYFSTITAPWDGTHPVSGNRAFGYYTDVNGNMVVYTRGVDRLADGTYMDGPNGLAIEIIQQSIAFSQADSKWSNFQSKIKDFVNEGQSTNNNGESTINIPVKYRPNWKKVKAVLNGIRPISDLDCN